MIEKKDPKSRSAEMLIPVWSHQHGAYISLITSWLIGTLLSTSLYWIHAVTLLFLLAGLNFGELVQEYLKKRLDTGLRKKVWTMVYGFLTLADRKSVV